MTLGREVIRQHASDTAGEPHAGCEVEEFVRPMSVGVRPENPGDHELGPRKLLAEHGHEGDRATFPHIARFFIEEL